MFGTGPFEDINTAYPPMPGAKPTPRLDRFFLVFTIVVLSVLVGIGWYFGG
jgi:hypothetical protein